MPDLARTHQACRLLLWQQGSLELVEYPQRKAENHRLGGPAERPLSDATLDMPSGMRAIPEEDDIAGAVARGLHGIVFKNDRAFENQDRLVEIIIPVELPLGAFPD